MSSVLMLYKFICVVAAGFMVGYWFYKFHKNENLTTIEFKSGHRIGKIIYPELTICCKNPFLNENLTEVSKGLNSKTYLNYLKGGNSFNDTYPNIKFDQVTLNLLKYSRRIKIIWKNFTIDNCDCLLYTSDAADE